MPLYLLRPRALPAWLAPLEKSTTPPGTRWITVHPNGDDEKGVPVLIRESTTHPGTYHVIGGADGKLQHLQLNRVGTKEDWDRRAKEKQAKKQAAAAAKGGAGGDEDDEDAGDEAGGVKAQTDEQLSEAGRRNQRQFVDAVAKKLGWDDNWYKDAGDFQGEGMTPTAAALAANAHLKNWVKQASEAHRGVQDRLRRDHEARISAGLGNLSLDTNPYRVTADELDAGALADKLDDHLARADALGEAAGDLGAQEAQVYQSLAMQVRASSPEDAQAVLGGLGRPNTAEGRAIFGQLQAGTLAPADAADALTKLAQGVASGDVRVDAAGDAAAHAEAAGLYRQALDALGAGDDAAATSHVEEAKRLVGDRGVSALDLIRTQGGEGRGYKAPERKRARADIHAEGLATPEALDTKIAQVEASAQSVLQRAAEGAWEGGVPVAVVDALNEQKKALGLAKEASLAGKPDLAADLILQAEKYQIAANKHADVSVKGQAAIVDGKRRMRDAHAEVRDAREEGQIQIGAGALDPEVRDMAAARDILVAAERFKERQEQLKTARKEAGGGQLDHARAIAESDKRVHPEPLDPATQARHEAAALRKIQESAESGIAAQLQARLEDEDYFRSFGGDRQIRRGQLDKYMASGADAMMTVLGQVVGGGQMLDRPVLDLLGPKAAARLMADYLANSRSGDELRAIRQGLEEYHKTRSAGVAAEALRACDECMDQARDFEIRGASTAYDLSEMEAYNGLRLKAVNQAMASVGTAYGELNMAAELNWALGGARKRADHLIEIDTGDRQDAALPVLAHAIGLRDGDFQVTASKRNRQTKQVQPGKIAVWGDGIKRVVREHPQEERQAAMRLGAIKRGEATTAADGTPVAGDQEGWLPKGIARRPHSTWQDPEKSPRRFDLTPDLTDASSDEVRDHAAARIAKGEPPHQVYLDLLNHPDLHERPGWAEGVNAAFGIHAGEDFNHEWLGKMRQRGNAIAKAWLGRTGAANIDLHTQAINEDANTVEAIHRTLAQHPYGVYAFKGVGDLSARDQAHVRDYFYQHIAKGLTPQERREKAKAEAPEPEYDTQGNLISASAPVGDADQTKEWNRYCDMMGGPEGALATTLDRIKSTTLGLYAQNHRQVTGQPLQVGEEAMPFGGSHYLAMLPQAEAQPLYGRILSERRGPARQAAIDQEVAAHQARHPGFATGALRRNRLGDQVEGQLAGMWGGVADNFNPGKPVKLVPNLRMDGRHVNQQRAVKAVRTQKRILMALGVGSGKTLVSLAGFTDAHHHGEARGALYAVPQAVQAQFGAEAGTYVDPNAGLKWHAKPGSEGPERQRALADTGTHMVVTTHQSLRDDVVKALADTDHGGDLKKAEKYLLEQPRALRAAAVKRAFASKGWAHRLDYFAVDEAHEMLNRKGKPNSLMANAIDAISDNAKHYVPMTGTPVKNDASEAYDWKRKIRPDQFTDAGEEDFLRTYGGLTDLTPRANQARAGQRGRADDPKDWSHVALAEAVQNDMAPHMFATRVPLTTTLRENNVRVPLGAAHRAKYDQVTRHYADANGAQARGGVNVAAVKALSPESFAGQPDGEHEAIARKLAPSLAMLREAAYNRALHTGRKDNDKLEALAKVIGTYRAQQSGYGHTGKAGIVFTTGIDAAHDVAARLRQDGHRVGLITGSMPTNEKEREKTKFQPLGDKAQWEHQARSDVLVATNTVSAGMDAPRGEFVVHHDVPLTAKLHEQRTARAHRLSNDHDVEVTNLVSDTPHELKGLARLKSKYGLADMMQNPAENLDDSGLQGQIARQRVGGAIARANARAQQPAGAGPRDLLAEARQVPRAGDAHVTAGQLQRQLKIGFNRAASLADQLRSERERQAPARRAG